MLQCLRPKLWTEFRSDCSENCDCTVGRQRFEDSDSEMVIAGNIIRRRGIARAIWFVCSILNYLRFVSLIPDM